MSANVSAVQALIENAKRLGLIWNLTPATVTTLQSGSNAARVQMDGDTNEIVVTSLVGVVGLGARVMVMTVPPSGNYIIGFYADPATRRALISSGTYECNGSVTLSTSYQVATGSTVTITLDRQSIVKVFMAQDFFCVVTGSVYTLGAIFINSVEQFNTIGLLKVANDRINPANAESFTLEAGTYVIEHKVRKDTATGTHQAIAGITRMVVDVYQ